MLVWIFNIFIFNVIIIIVKFGRIILTFFNDNIKIFILQFFIYKYLNNVIKFFLMLEFRQFFEFILKNMGVILCIGILLIYKYFILILVLIFALHFAVFLWLKFVHEHSKDIIANWLDNFFFFIGGTICFSFQLVYIELELCYILF